MSAMSTPRIEIVRSRFLELTNEEWALLGLGAATLVAVVDWIRPDVTLWPALGLFFTAIVFGHMCMSAARYVAFPDLVVFAACLQWVVAPWLADAYPPRLPLFRNSIPATEYLPYALASTVALWIGLQLLPSRYLDKSWWYPTLEPLPPRVRRLFDGIIFAGLMAGWYSSLVPASLAFLAYLVSSFRFFAAMGWMVTETPGWRLRIAIVFVLLAVESTTGGMFYLVVHWGGYFAMLYAFMRHWRWKLGAAVLVGLAALGVLQQIKPAYRAKINAEEYGTAAAVKLFAGMMWDRARGVNQADVELDFGDTLVRFNQGWIISRIMVHVPKVQPYARGQTLTDAALYSVVPRFLFPGKAIGASQETFLKYTGVALPPGTTMGLGIIGEMYANFGFGGGILATFMYGILLGGVFYFLAKRALINPLWWAVGSVVLLPAAEPGINIEDIANHVVKASIVLMILWRLVPTMRHLLSTAPSSDDDDRTVDLPPTLDDAVVDH
jgi:hypothetical protein